MNAIYESVIVTFEALPTVVDMFRDTSHVMNH